MQKKRVILWFRNDLRLHDNEALCDAVQSSCDVIPVFVFDDRLFGGRTNYGFRKTGTFRARFILESVADLRDSLRKLGSELIIRRGQPESVICELAKELRTSWVFCNRERTDEEVRVQDRLERNLWAIGQEVRYSRGKMLYYTADLPFPVTHTPDTFTSFKKEVEKIVKVRSPLAIPQVIPFINQKPEVGDLPTMKDLGYSEEDRVLSRQSPFPGGEQAALRRMKAYFWETEAVAQYKHSRDNMTGKDSSTRFSAYLSQGCLSPKTVFHEIKKFEREIEPNESTYSLFLELMWRDFLRLLGKKHGNDIFKRGGIRRVDPSGLTEDNHVFRIWAEGRTGIPFVDASMKELNETGYMSNRSRRNAASFLVNDMSLNWQMGAEYFESLLTDYDPCSNWGNWNFLAGLSNDSKENRSYNVQTQAKKYDPRGEYVRHWLPVLKNVPDEYVHEPSFMPEAEQLRLDFILGRDYPKSFIRIEV